MEEMQKLIYNLDPKSHVTLPYVFCSECEERMFAITPNLENHAKMKHSAQLIEVVFKRD